MDDCSIHESLPYTFIKRCKDEEELMILANAHKMRSILLELKQVARRLNKMAETDREVKFVDSINEELSEIHYLL